MQKSHIETLLDIRRLTSAAERDAQSYQRATPFPHISLDGFMPEDIYREALAQYPTPEQVSDWRRVEASDDKGRIAQNLKLGYSDEQHMPQVLRELIYTLNSSVFLRYLEKLTGIPNLLPDPHLVGGGLHQYLPGAILRVHADFSKLRGSLLDRRLNLLLYLNEQWHEEWGG
jgi:Rps23 Pro-64 3,4-dihydroxylase Tpa1-like proline 4-hydroxylase